MLKILELLVEAVGRLLLEIDAVRTEKVFASLGLIEASVSAYLARFCLRGPFEKWGWVAEMKQWE